MIRKALPILGLLLLALFIWVAGPFFGFLEYHPLEPWIARLVLILLIVGAWAASKVVKKLKAIRASDQLVAAVVRQSAAEERPSAEALQLRERFEEAVATLKSQRRSGHSLYDLPWYAIIGAPGSGKTTALINSGLHFPLEQRSGRGALQGIGGTRNCDWWFTDEAVFLDTAGRYLTQDSDATADSAGWLEFLALLRRVPPPPPIERHPPHDQRPRSDAGLHRPRGAHRRGPPPTERAEPRAARAASRLPDGDEGRPGIGVHRVLRRPHARGAAAGVGGDVPVRADGGRHGRRGVCRRSSIGCWRG